MDVQVRIDRGTHKTYTMKESINLLVPSPRGLLKTIQRLLQPLNLSIGVWFMKPRRLINIDLLFQVTIQEGRLNLVHGEL